MSGYYGGTMNVNIRGSGDDVGFSQGLCGRLANDTSKNLYIRNTNKTFKSNGDSWYRPKEFSDSWRPVQ